MASGEVGNFILLAGGSSQRHSFSVEYVAGAAVGWMENRRVVDSGFEVDISSANSIGVLVCFDYFMDDAGWFFHLERRQLAGVDDGVGW